MFASEYNKTLINWGIETEGFEYHSLSELSEGTRIKVRGLYINTKGKYGDAPVLISDTCYYNLPSYMTETVREMLKDDELIEQIKSGKVFADVRHFIDSKHNRDSYTIDWVDA